MIKEILPENTYKVRSNQGRISKKFDSGYLSKVADNTNKMIKAGLKIPAPFDHNKKAKPLTQEEIEKEIETNKGSSSFNNAGYWKSFWVAPNEKGIPTLYGQVDVAGDISDPNSPAFKAKNTAKEVSISLADQYEDGLSRTWTDGLLHVALVTHAVVPDQSDFEESATIVNMSMTEEGEETNEKSTSDNKVIGELKAALKKIKVTLPDSTDVKTFLRDLLVAVSQISELDTEKLEPAPIYMSIGDDMKLSQQAAEALVKSGAVNPDTKKPFTMEDFGFTTQGNLNLSTLEAKLTEANNAIAGLKAINNAWKNKYQQEKQAILSSRIAKLVANGLPKEFADTALIPKLTVEMSVLADGNFSEHPLEVTLSALEATMPAKATPSTPQFPGSIQDNPWVDGTSDVTDEQMNAALKALESDGNL